MITPQPPEHGGNLHAARRRFGRSEDAWLDLSTGINPHAYPVPTIPPSIWARLPGHTDALQRAAAQYYGCGAVMLTPGSQWSIHHLPGAFKALGDDVKSVLVPQHAYAEHAYHWALSGARVRAYEGLPGAAALHDADVCVVLNPHNPTGCLHTRAQLEVLLAAALEARCVLVVDEAFIDPHPEQSMVHYCDAGNLVVLRSFGKFFGLAGLRLGAIAGHPGVRSVLSAALPLWTLTGPSVYVATQAFEDKAWQAQMRTQLAYESATFAAQLRRVDMGHVSGCGLFQTVRFDSAHCARRVHETLAEQGIWVRHIAGTGMLRFGLPVGPADTDRVITQLERAKALLADGEQVRRETDCVD